MLCQSADPCCRAPQLCNRSWPGISHTKNETGSEPKELSKGGNLQRILDRHRPMSCKHKATMLCQSADPWSRPPRASDRVWQGVSHCRKKTGGVLRICLDAHQVASFPAMRYAMTLGLSQRVDDQRYLFSCRRQHCSRPPTDCQLFYSAATVQVLQLALVPLPLTAGSDMSSCAGLCLPYDTALPTTQQPVKGPGRHAGSTQNCPWLASSGNSPQRLSCNDQETASSLLPA